MYRNLSREEKQRLALAWALWAGRNMLVGFYCNAKTAPAPAGSQGA